MIAPKESAFSEEDIDIKWVTPEALKSYPITKEQIRMKGERLVSRPLLKEETGISLLKILAYVFGVATTFSGVVVARSYFLAEPFWSMIIIPFIIVMTPLTTLIYYWRKMMLLFLSSS